jgi:tyrosyl-tRNA synthetase
MAIPTSGKDHDALALLRARGFVQQITDEAALGARLGAGQVTFYAGFDPTAASLHVGSAIPLMAMAHLARAGHRPIAVLGGGTAMVGDPSGKSEMRQIISADTIAANRAGIEPQVRQIIGADALVVDNGDWLLPLNYIAFLRDIGRHFSVNRMLAAEAYKMRLEKGLSFIEFNYQLLQAFDFLTLNERYGCALQIGGDDQWGNILAGVDLTRRVRQKEVFGLTFPLLTTATGAKMGKTASGAVWLDARLTTPFDFFQYFVNVDDRDVVRFLKLLTFEPLEEIARFETVEGAELRDAKRLLARAVTAIVHGEAAAAAADAQARAAFGGGDAPGGNSAEVAAALPTAVLDPARVAAGLKIADVIAEAGLAPSKSAARRLIEQGGVRMGARKITAIDDVVAAADLTDAGTLLHVGKKHIRRLVVGPG